MPATLSETKHAAILQAAIQVFREFGYADAGVDIIAARAEVSKRTLYKHFAGKEALFREISDQLCQSVVAVTNMAFDPDRTLEDQLLELAHRELDLMTSEDFVTMARVTLPECARRPELAGKSYDRIRCGETGLARWVEEAVAAGRLEDVDPAAASKQFSALLSKFAFWPQIFANEPAPSRKEREEIAGSAVRLFLRGYGVTPQRSR
jgi:TetR/AcrR family transcriptional regulator of autoinduction and epiphytic fitness